MHVLFCMIIVLAVNWIAIFAYCSLQRFLEKVKNPKQDDMNLENTHSNKILYKRVGLLKKLYQIVNRYVYGWVRYNIILAGHIPSYTIRKLFYKFVFRMNICWKTVIFGGCEFRSPWNIKIGNSVIGANCILDGRTGIEIGDNVVLGNGVHIWTQQHDVNDPYFRANPWNKKKVVIHDRSWIASDSTILPGITIGEGAVVASRAYVNHDCDSFTIYGGVPAIKIGERTHDLKYILSGKPTWHFY